MPRYVGHGGPPAPATQSTIAGLRDPASACTWMEVLVGSLAVKRNQLPIMTPEAFHLLFYQILHHHTPHDALASCRNVPNKLYCLLSQFVTPSLRSAIANGMLRRPILPLLVCNLYMA